MQTRHSRIIFITTNTSNPIESLLKSKAPSLEKLNQHQVFFSNLIPPTPALLPSATSLMTGLYPYEHGVRLNRAHFLAFQYTTLAELFSQKGYQTHAIVSSEHLSSRHQLNQGFQTYQLQEKPASFFFRQASELLQASSKIFLWLHLSDFDPRSSTDPLPSKKTEDEQSLEAFLTFLLETDASNTILVFLKIPENDFDVFPPPDPSNLSSFQSVAFLYSAHVPAHSNSMPISFVDFLPTLYPFALGEPLPSSFYCAGTNLTPFLESDALAPADRWIYFENLFPHFYFGAPPFFGLQNQQWRFIHEAQTGLYSTKNLRLPENSANHHPDLTQQLEALLLERFQKNFFEGTTLQEGEPAFFFLTSFKKDSLFPPTDCKSFSEIFSDYLLWKQAQVLAEKNPEDYIQKMKSLAISFPLGFEFYRRIIETGFALRDQLSGLSQRFVQDSIDQIYQLDPQHPFSIYYKGLLFYNQNQYETALEHFLKILYTAPDEPETNFLVGSIFFRYKDKRAIPFLKKYLQLVSPSAPNASLANQMLSAFQ